MINIFDIHRSIIKDYRSYVESFINIRNSKINEIVRQEIDSEKLWPEPLIEFNPAYKSGDSVESLIDANILHPEMKDALKDFYLHDHQTEAIKLGCSERDFFVTSGTGSGKSLTYFTTIFN